MTKKGFIESIFSRSFDRALHLKEKMDRSSKLGIVEHTKDQLESSTSQKQSEFSKFHNFSSKSGIFNIGNNEKSNVTKLAKPMSSNNIIRIGSTERVNISDKGRYKTYGNNTKDVQQGNLKTGLKHASKSRQLIPSFTGSPRDSQLTSTFLKGNQRESHYSMKLNEILEQNLNLKDPVVKSKHQMTYSNLINSQQFIFM
jgi:hypothetical protein